MTVEEVMERVGSRDPGKVIAYIKDAFNLMAIRGKDMITTSRSDIVSDRVYYGFPSGMERLEAVHVLYQSNASELMDDNDRDLGGSNNWTNTDFATFDSTTDLSVTSDAADQSCYLDDTDIMTEGLRYRLYYDATITNGVFELQEYTSSTKLGTFENATQGVLEFEISATDTFKIVETTGNGAADFDNFSLKRIGKDKWRPASRIIGRTTYDYFDDETTSTGGVCDMSSCTGRVYSGSGSPASGLGGVGDFYMDTATRLWYGPKTGSGWGSPFIPTLDGSVATLTANDGTPTLSADTNVYQTANTSATTYTAFTSQTSSYGRTIYVYIEDNNSTFEHSATFDCGGTDLGPSTGDIVILTWRESLWYVQMYRTV